MRWLSDFDDRTIASLDCSCERCITNTQNFALGVLTANIKSCLQYLGKDMFHIQVWRTMTWRMLRLDLKLAQRLQPWLRLRAKWFWPRWWILQAQWLGTVQVRLCACPDYPLTELRTKSLCIILCNQLKMAGSITSSHVISRRKREFEKIEIGIDWYDCLNTYLSTYLCE